MDIFNFLSMIGGLSLFLFGMNLMGEALERSAGSKLRNILEKMTSNKLAGFLTGCGVTAIIQSSSATTVMVVGFVNSGLMTLRQAINVIMGANVGTTVTSWILSLSGISSSNVWIRLLKPSSFTPILALIGVILYMFIPGANNKNKDIGVILLGFATLMFGMETMSSAVSGLSQVEGFQKMFVMFQNPLLGLLVGAVLTAIIQSSSASVGILQALSTTGQVTFGAAVPIIMGQNIGTCVTALISSVGANKNAKRAAVVHLSFNILGSLIMLTLFCIWKFMFAPVILSQTANTLGIAIIHTAFNISCVAILLPNAGLLEKLSLIIIKDEQSENVKHTELETIDQRLLATPTLALEQCHRVTVNMAETAIRALNDSLTAATKYTTELADSIRQDEEACDKYEDMIGTYLVTLSSKPLGTLESEEATSLLKMIGDFERISDYAVNIVASFEELRDKKKTLTESAIREYEVLADATREILDLTRSAFLQNDAQLASEIEPLKKVIDDLKESMRTRHTKRMQQGKCSIETGFIWSDILTNVERTAAHCTNISGCIVDMEEHNLNLHQTQKVNFDEREKEEYKNMYDNYYGKLSLI